MERNAPVSAKGFSRGCVMTRKNTWILKPANVKINIVKCTESDQVTKLITKRLNIFYR